MSIGIHNLRGPKGARRATKRKGLGPASGQGKTAGKGHKGQLARRGKGKPRMGFEGGQIPLIRRLPKFGFNNIFRTEYQIVSLERLADLKGETITPELVNKKGLVSSRRKPIKVLHSKDFKLTEKLDIKLHRISNAAKTAVESAGGSFQEIS